MNAPIAPSAPTPTAARSLLRRVFPFLWPVAMLWLTWGDARVPSFLSPTVQRTLYFKLPIAGTRFHWIFLDRRAFLSGELTVRIVNAGRDRDQTLVVFRDGKISEGWEMIGDMPRDSGVYFGFSTGQRFATSVGDSVIVTLIATEDLRGQGPYTQGTLAKGTWVATGTYHSLFGGTLNPLRDLVIMSEPPVAFLTCWDTTWMLQDVRHEGWMGSKPTGEDDPSLMRKLRPDRGVDGRRCRSTL